MRDVLGTGYLFLPLLGGGVFHGLCMKLGWLSFLKSPIDRGYQVRGRRLFGSNKTFRGVVAVGIGTAILLGLQATVLHRLPAVRGIELFVSPKLQTEALDRFKEFFRTRSESATSRIELKKETDVSVARAEARRICENAGASAFSMQKVTTIVSELARNIVLYAQRVSHAGKVGAAICNFSGTSMVPIVDLPVRVITFG